jgi:hypothetical protein
MQSKPLYHTAKGQAYVGDSLVLLAELPDDSVDLVMTSPQFALRCQKTYGNVAGSTGFCGQTLHPRRDPATSMFWSQLEWYWNPFSASKGEARAPS